MENFMRWKIMGGPMYMKKHVIPHIFECQKTKNPESRKSGVVRRRQQVIENMISEEIQETQSEELQEPQQELSSEKAVQVNLTKKVVSKAVNTNFFTCKISTASSPIKAFNGPKLGPARIIKEDVDEQDFMEVEDKNDSDFICSEDDYEDETFEDEGLKNYMQVGFLKLIRQKPQLYLGLPAQMYFVIDDLSQRVHVSVLNLLITLKKIRLDLSYKLLGAHFGVSESYVCRTFKQSLPKLAVKLSQIIFWPTEKEIRASLPISFRNRYQNVQSIIDCFEIQIEKPTNPLHQSLTWSAYKGCNTIKYLISVTPGGLINFLSKGYSGRVSDSNIVEHSDYLKNLKRGVAVMADRGFKNVSHMLHERGASLIRPPSVPANTILSKDSARQAKQIAALRIHVERAISRIREYDMVKMHSTIDIKLVPSLDCVVHIVCGLINLQQRLIKT
jgi:DNA-directed RNA polymerase specialized sigma subunit